MSKHLSSYSGDDVAFNAELKKWWSDHPEDTALHEESDQLFNRADPIAESILSIQPRTLAGLAALARAVAVSNPTLWHDDDVDRRYKNRDLKRLIEATCDLAGVPYPPNAA
jgi:hypothetical protein